MPRRLAFGVGTLVLLAAVIAAARIAGTARAETTSSSATGTWRRLPAAPISPGPGAVSVWTGKQLIVFGRAQPHPPWSVDVAAAYDPATRAWRKLSPFPGDRGNYEGRYTALWTGKEVLVFGPFDDQAYNPATNRWRRLPRATPAEFALGLVVWTGREAIAWGGGCCGDASSSGASFDPKTNRFRKLARSPLAPAQGPMGAWAGHELLVLVSGLDPDGKPYPAPLARAAAYDPTTNTWRRIAPLPAPRAAANVVWDGREALVVGGSGASGRGPARLPRAVFAYDPAPNRWRQLAPMASGRADFAAVWTGKRLLVWAGRTTVAGPPQYPPRGFALDPQLNRWSTLARAPLVGRVSPTAAWTGRTMIVWGGTSVGSRALDDGAAFTPAKP